MRKKNNVEELQREFRKLMSSIFEGDSKEKVEAWIMIMRKNF